MVAGRMCSDGRSKHYLQISPKPSNNNYLITPESIEP
jgi:hypothetical protein